MDNLTIEHLACYLPYGLKCHVVDRGESKVAELSALYIDGSCSFSDIVESSQGFTSVTPLLRSLDQLTQEIEHNGERFVPIVALAKIGMPEGDFGDIDPETIHEPSSTVASIRGYIFGYFAHTFYIKSGRSDAFTARHQLQLFQKLYSWHFDVHGLLDKRLALPIQNDLPDAGDYVESADGKIKIYKNGE